MFHTLYVLVCSPFNIVDPDEGYTESTAFVLAQEHALRATAWLKFLLDLPANTEFASGFFQFCILRTGLVHVSFLRALAGRHPGSSLVAEAQRHIRIHTLAFVAAQRGHEWRKIGAGEMSREETRHLHLTYWYRSWLQAISSS